MYQFDESDKRASLQIIYVSSGEGDQANFLLLQKVCRQFFPSGFDDLIKLSIMVSFYLAREKGFSRKYPNSPGFLFCCSFLKFEKNQNNSPLPLSIKILCHRTLEMTRKRLRMKNAGILMANRIIYVF